MKRLIIIIFFGVVLQSFCFSQTQNKRLRIYSITEYIDGYVIKAVDTSKPDTLNIISVKEAVKNKHEVERLLVGKTYNFQYEDYKMAAMPPNNFVIRIKTTVVWKGSDAIKDKPVFAKNIQGLFIKKE